MSGARIWLMKNILGEFIRELRNTSDYLGLQKALDDTTGLFLLLACKVNKSLAISITVLCLFLSQTFF